MKYTQPFDQPGNPNASFVDGNPASGIQGSIVPAGALEPSQREIVYSITQSGQTPTDGDNTQLWQAITKNRTGWDDTGTANAVVITPSPAITAYSAYQVFRIKLLNTITGASVINVSGLGNKALTRADTSPTQNGDGVAGQVLEVVYDGTQFQIDGLRTQVPGSNVQTFNTPGTTNFTVPPGVFEISSELWGGGGGSGGTVGAGSASLGGGGGAFSKKLCAVTPGQVIAVTVGAAGTAGATTTAGGNGGTSSFGAFHSATGGVGGIPANGGTAGGVSAGGTATGGDINISGESSSNPFAISGAVVTSKGGDSPRGGAGGHFGATSISASGTGGATPGGGAGGAAAAAAGATGGVGTVYLEW